MDLKEQNQAEQLYGFFSVFEHDPTPACLLVEESHGLNLVFANQAFQGLFEPWLQSRMGQAVEQAFERVEGFAAKARECQRQSLLSRADFELAFGPSPAAKASVRFVPWQASVVCFFELPPPRRQSCCGLDPESDLWLELDIEGRISKLSAPLADRLGLPGPWQGRPAAEMEPLRPLLRLARETSWNVSAHAVAEAVALVDPQGQGITLSACCWPLRENGVHRGYQISLSPPPGPPHERPDEWHRHILSSTFDGIEEAIAVTDRGEAIRACNRAFEVLMGHDANWLLGKPIGQMLGLEESLPPKSLGAEVFFPFRTYAGSVFFGEMKVSELPDERGGFVFVVRDISARLQVVEQMEKAKEEAQRGEALKASFLRNMSHEIRTPLNGILGFSSMLQRQCKDLPRQLRHAQIINECGHQLLSIVDDVLDISEIETETVELNPTSTRAGDVLRDIFETYHPIALAKKIDLVLENNLPAEHEFVCDAKKLGKVLGKFCSNAIKFSEQGRIKLGVAEHDGRMDFWVSDQGLGIAPENHERVFERFFQVETGITRNYGGNGLGLAVAKSFAAMMGGQVWVESSLGVGSRFVLSLPLLLAGSSPAKETQPPARLPARPTVLVAEDEPLNFIFIEELLRDLGVEVLHAKNGSQAVSLARGRLAHLVLMDIKMPVMDGIEATRMIKGEMPWLPIVAQTAFTNLGSERDFDESIFDDLLVKPISKTKLMRLLEKFLPESAKASL